MFYTQLYFPKNTPEYIKYKVLTTKALSFSLKTKEKSFVERTVVMVKEITWSITTYIQVQQEKLLTWYCEKYPLSSTYSHWSSCYTFSTYINAAWSSWVFQIGFKCNTEMLTWNRFAYIYHLFQEQYIIKKKLPIF